MELSYRNVQVIDSWLLLSDANDTLAPEYQIGDGVHLLSAAGYQRIADELFSVGFNSTPYESGRNNTWRDPMVGWGLIGVWGPSAGCSTSRAEG